MCFYQPRLVRICMQFCLVELFFLGISSVISLVRPFRHSQHPDQPDHPAHLFQQFLQINQFKQIKRPVLLSAVLPRLVIVKRSFACLLPGKVETGRICKIAVKRSQLPSFLVMSNIFNNIFLLLFKIPQFKAPLRNLHY